MRTKFPLQTIEYRKFKWDRTIIATNNKVTEA